jgi:hypothetical protein
MSLRRFENHERFGGAGFPTCADIWMAGVLHNFFKVVAYELAVHP